jgi:type II secretory pathway component PulF
MPRFNYTARDRSGQSVSAGLEASSRKEALRLLAARGLTPVGVSEAGAAGSQSPDASKKSATTEPPAKFRFRLTKSAAVTR